MAMIVKVVTFWMLIVPMLMQAEPVKYELNGGFRTFPIGGVVSAKGEKKYIIWGDQGAEAQPNFKHGFVAPSATFYTAGTFNALKAEVALFPISFIGIKLGKATSFNNKEYSAYDCETYHCIGGVDKNFIEFHGAYKYKSVFYKLKLVRHSVSQRDEFQSDFMDSSTGLVLKHSGDKIHIDQHLAGYFINDKWVVSALHIKATAIEVRNHSEQNTINFTWKKDKNWQHNMAFGGYVSSILDGKSTFLYQGTYRY